MVRTRKKNTEEEKKIRRRERNKLIMRKLREKIKHDPVALAEKRRKDREYYYNKKEKGLIKTIKDLNPRAQRNLRKKWREEAKKRRELKKIQKRTEEFLVRETPPETPSSSMHASRVTSSKALSTERKILLKKQNIYLRRKLRILEKRLAKYRMREYRLNLEKKNCNVQFKRNKKQENKKEKVRKSIQQFLENDSNSRLTTGKNDTKSRNKKRIQLRLLNDTLLNLYAAFKKETGLNISYKTFCRYRPFWIVSPKVTTRNTCLCALHENTDYIVKALKSAKVINENCAKEVAKSLCCDGKLKEKCLERLCSNCSDKVINIYQHFPSDTIFYYRWVTKKVPTIVKGQNKLCQKTLKEKVQTNKNCLIELLRSKMSVFMKHLANMYHQQNAVINIKEKLTPQNGILHMDFSENYSCKYASEIQSAHFGGSRNQLTLHTSVFYYYDEENGTSVPPLHKSYCTVSENMRHNPVLICAHLKPIIQKLRSLVPALKSIHFLSDGPSTQYRNRKMFNLLINYLSEKLEVDEMFWHYSESGHGKGAPDGVGGCLKNAADNHVANGYDVPDIESFVRCVQEKVREIEVIRIDDSEINDIEGRLEHVNKKPFKGTFQIHQLAWHKDEPLLLHARRLSCINCPANVICSHYEIGQIKINSSIYASAEATLNELNQPSHSRFFRKRTYSMDVISDSEDNIPLSVLRVSNKRIEPTQNSEAPIKAQELSEESSDYDIF